VSRLGPRVLAVVVAAAVVVVAALGLTGGVSSSQRAVGRGLTALPFGARGLVSRTLGRDDRRFWVRRRAAEWLARNPAQGLDLSFGHSGVVVRSGGLSWSVGLRAVGYGARLAPVPGATPRARANRVVFGRDAVQEWYANGPLGLEQGFTLSSPPAVGGGGPLTLALGLPAGVSARRGHAGGELLLERSGRALLQYGGLSAVDARGRSLRAWLQARAGRLLVRVDDRGARYPVRVDPLVQGAKLTASDGASFDQLGSSVAVSSDGSTVVVGAPFVNSLRGAAYVFVRQSGVWTGATQTAKLTASDGAAGDALGSSVAVSGDGSTVVSGGYLAKVGTNTRQGAVYVFQRPGGGWTTGSQTAKLTVSGGATDDFLGESVGVSADGSVVAAGAPNVNLGVNGSKGAAYVFVRPETGWVPTGTPTAGLSASDTPANGQLGLAVAVSSDGFDVIAGAPFAAGSAGASQGAAYVFSAQPLFGPPDWTHSLTQAKLTASDGATNDLFGSSVAISAGSTAVAGGRSGAVYVFQRPGVLFWSNTFQRAKLTASDGASLGSSVGVSADGSAVVAGAPAAQVGANASQGAVYGFERPSSGWANSTQVARMTAPDGAAGDALGASVALSGDGLTTVAGAPQAQIGMTTHQGAAYILPASSSTSVNCQPAPVVVGVASACTATVTDAGPGTVTPTGSVSFSTASSGSFGAGGSCTLAPTATAGVASCQVSYTPSAVASGTHTITAGYGGTANHSASQGTIPLAVTVASASTSVGCQPPSVIVGRQSACTATVTDTASGSVTPTGSVSFTGGSGSFGAGGSCTLTPTGTAGVASCQVSYTPSAVASGTHTITAGYGGDANHSASQGTATVRVSAASTSTSVGCQPLTVVAGRATSCTATVTDTASGSDTPAGAVSFKTGSKGSFGGGGSCSLAPTATAGVASCQATYTPSAVGSGTHTITASYGGDAAHIASHGAVLVAVSPAPIVRIGSGKLIVVKGVVAIKLSCPAGETFCGGTVSIYTTQAFAASNKKPRNRPLLLGRAGFHIAGGKTQTVKIHVGRQSLGRLGARNTVRVTVIVLAHDQAGRSATTKSTTTLVLHQTHKR
jgi:hypothetical protein